MRVADPRSSQDLVQRKVVQLRASGLSETHLRLGAAEAVRQKLPLRDAIVLREARRFAGMASPEAEAAWTDAMQRVKAAVPESTFAIWFAPLSLLGGQTPHLHVLSPQGIRTWLERRYLPLIREALQAGGSGYIDVEFVSAGENS